MSEPSKIPETSDGASDQRLVRRCPICGKPPSMKRYSSSFWYARCEDSHLGESSSHPMKTKKAAWEEWDYKFPPNNRILESHEIPKEAD